MIKRLHAVASSYRITYNNFPAMMLWHLLITFCTCSHVFLLHQCTDCDYLYVFTFRIVHLATLLVGGENPQSTRWAVPYMVTYLDWTIKNPAIKEPMKMSLTDHCGGSWSPKKRRKNLRRCVPIRHVTIM